MEDSLFSKWWCDSMQISEVRTLPHIIHKNKLKWLKDLNIRYDIIQLLEENVGKAFSHINHSNIFLSQPPPKKAKINKWHLLKLISFCTAKYVNKMKRQTTDREKIFAKNATYKGLMFKICKQLIQFSIKKKICFKWAEDPNRHFYKDIQIANRHMKRCSI